MKERKPWGVAVDHADQSQMCDGGTGGQEDTVMGAESRGGGEARQQMRQSPGGGKIECGNIKAVVLSDI